MIGRFRSACPKLLKAAEDRLHHGHGPENQGYATGQFGTNHQGDRDKHLPTIHGFDEFLASLYHLNAEEEPEQRDCPGNMKLAIDKTFREQFGPRGVLKCKADIKGGQSIEDLDPRFHK